MAHDRRPIRMSTMELLLVASLLGSLLLALLQALQDQRRQRVAHPADRHT